MESASDRARAKLLEKVKEIEDGVKERSSIALKKLTESFHNAERKVLQTVMQNTTLAKAVYATLPKLFEAEEENGVDEEMERMETMDPTVVSLSLTLVGMEHIPVNQKYFQSRNIAKSGHSVTISVLRGLERQSVRKQHSETVFTQDGNPKFNEIIDLGKVRLDDTLSFTVNSSYFETRLTNPINWQLGTARVRVSDFIANSVCEEDENEAKVSFWMTDPSSGTIVFDYDLINPCVLKVSYDRTSINCGLSPKILQTGMEEDPNGNKQTEYPKHVFIMTRGTRGDVQPFIALARGLAEEAGWLVTICTEERYRPLIERYSEVSQGKIQFKVSGGDTEERIDGAVSKWAFNQKSDLLQMVILGRSEREFFDTEPAFYYWASRLQPDLIMFGFTVANMAMILSESLQIPMIGFLLQPTGIPSKQYPSVVPLDWAMKPETAHKWNYRIKLFFENNPIDNTAMLNSMRANRGLSPFSHRVNNLTLMMKQNVPLVIPINETAFGGRPDDWNEHAVLTDFIFLRNGAVPNLKPKFMKIILDAHANREPVVVLCFSSMPVGRIRILEMCLMILNQCERKPRVIGLIGNRAMAEIPSEAQTAKSIKIEEEAAEHVSTGRLLIEGGAPFSKLFPLVDFVLMHGGLGTTAECLLAGVPCMVSGVLLLDQRFWGRRVFELGVAPEPVHINELEKVIVKNVDVALSPGSSYAAKAEEIAKLLKSKNVGTGVNINVRAVVDLAEKARPVLVHRESITKKGSRFARELAKDLSAVAKDEVVAASGLAAKKVKSSARPIARSIHDRLQRNSHLIPGLVKTTVLHNGYELREKFKYNVKQRALKREHES